MRYSVMVGLAETVPVVEWRSLGVRRTVPVVELAIPVVVPARQVEVPALRTA